ncbi:MAG: hypothetical protein H8D67_10795 [Deltaproteobacteria bacterium]|nr:hypothetical protein [Deltaproteobacteria bacterium]
MTSTRRKFASVLFGIFYGGSLVNGIDFGLEYVLDVEDSVIGQWPLVEIAIQIAGVMLGAFLAAYSAQSFLTGMLTGGIMSVILMALVAFLHQAGTFFSCIVVVLGLGVTIPVVFYGTKLTLSTEDLSTGRLFGVSWKHWLWLWLPWQGMIANAVWLSYPASLLAGEKTGIRMLVFDVVKAPTCLVLLAYAVLKALKSIRADSPYSRLQSALMFIGWVVLFPILINIGRIFLF